ncbi:MAG: hypothetical protein M5R42_09515 [Rhodocyclaceae bacterium]|nr:hypothetical protein [Rhodocyclaceae bacterium]
MGHADFDLVSVAHHGGDQRHVLFIIDLGEVLRLRGASSRNWPMKRLEVGIVGQAAHEIPLRCIHPPGGSADDDLGAVEQRWVRTKCCGVIRHRRCGSYS